MKQLFIHALSPVKLYQSKSSRENLFNKQYNYFDKVFGIGVIVYIGPDGQIFHFTSKGARLVESFAKASVFFLSIGIRIL